jgi:hypothetical protein
VQLEELALGQAVGASLCLLPQMSRLPLRLPMLLGLLRLLLRSPRGGDVAQTLERGVGVRLHALKRCRFRPVALRSAHPPVDCSARLTTEEPAELPWGSLSSLVLRRFLSLTARASCAVGPP